MHILEQFRKMFFKIDRNFEKLRKFEKNLKKIWESYWRTNFFKNLLKFGENLLKIKDKLCK